MHVTMLQTVQHGAQTLNAGVNLDAPDDVVQGWIDAGLAQIVESAAQPEPDDDVDGEARPARARNRRASA